jgi:hypothetical protein
MKITSIRDQVVMLVALSATSCCANVKRRLRAACNRRLLNTDFFANIPRVDNSRLPNQSRRKVILSGETKDREQIVKSS